MNNLRKNGCLRTDNKVLEAYLFQYNGISFFAAWHKNVFIPLNPAGPVIVTGMAEKMDRTELDLIPTHLFEEVKDLYEIITDLNKKHGADYCTYYVFDTLKKERILELPKGEQKKISIKYRKPVYAEGVNLKVADSKEEYGELKNSLQKICSGIFDEKGHLLVNWFGTFFYMHPENGKRYVSEKEIKNGPLQIADWVQAVDKWKKPDGTKSLTFELRDINMYQKCAALSQEVKRNFLFGMSPEEMGRAKNSAGYKKILEQKNSRRTEFVQSVASNTLRDFANIKS